MPDAKTILTACPIPWRTGGDHQGALVLRGLDEDYPAGPVSKNLSMNEAIVMDQNFHSGD